MNSEIFSKVISIVANSLNIKESEITADKTFQELGADSLDSVEIIMQIETELDIAIPDNDMEKFTNIRSVVDYIDAHTPTPAAE